MSELPPAPDGSFASDNAAGVSPEVMDALAAANHGSALAYGDDDLTRLARSAIAEVFDARVQSYFCWGGTGANVVGLASVLQPWQAVLWAAFFNFISFLVLPLEVANAIAKIVSSDVISIGLVFAGLMGAIFWNVLTAWMGLPSSSSHALIGGMVGAGIAKAGGHVVSLTTLKKTGVFIIYSPLIGLLLGFTLLIVVMWIVHKIRAKRAVNKTFRGLQLLSAAAFSLGHGANDAQKTMGIIAALLIGAKHLDKSVLDNPDGLPLWIVLSCHAAIALGTMMGGWKIVRTMGTKLTSPVSVISSVKSSMAPIYGV